MPRPQSRLTRWPRAGRVWRLRNIVPHPGLKTLLLHIQSMPSHQGTQLSVGCPQPRPRPSQPQRRPDPKRTRRDQPTEHMTTCELWPGCSEPYLPMIPTTAERTAGALARKIPKHPPRSTHPTPVQQILQAGPRLARIFTAACGVQVLAASSSSGIRYMPQALTKAKANPADKRFFSWPHPAPLAYNQRFPDCLWLTSFDRASKPEKTAGPKSLSQIAIPIRLHTPKLPAN